MVYDLWILHQISKVFLVVFANFSNIEVGECFFDIGKRFGIDFRELMRLNAATPGTILRPGDKLLLFPKGSPAFNGMLLTHLVQPGDTLWDIARMYRVPVQAIIKANSIDEPSRLMPGHKLLIPAGGGGR